MWDFQHPRIRILLLNIRGCRDLIILGVAFVYALYIYAFMSINEIVIYAHIYKRIV